MIFEINEIVLFIVHLPSLLQFSNMVTRAFSPPILVTWWLLLQLFCFRISSMWVSFIDCVRCSSSLVCEFVRCQLRWRILFVRFVWLRHFVVCALLPFSLCSRLSQLVIVPHLVRVVVAFYSFAPICAKLFSIYVCSSVFFNWRFLLCLPSYSCFLLALFFIDCLVLFSWLRLRSLLS